MSDFETSNQVTGSAGQVVQAGAVDQVNNNYYGAVPAGQTVPWECPPAAAVFVDREDELAAMVASGGGLFVVDGAPGAGKSALVRRFAAAVADRFPDGQLYADVRDHRRGGGVELTGLVGGMLLSLGVRGDWLPAELTGRVASLRSVLKHKKVLIVVDHVTTAEQVSRWLPDAPGCAVAVTSNLDLDELYQHGAVRVPVERLGVADGVELLRRYTGVRVDAEIEAAQRLAELCEGLPMALNVVGSRLRRRKSLRLADVVAELAANRLESPVVRAAFDSAFDDLPEQARRLYTLLGVHPGADLGLAVVRVLMPAPELVLEELERANLVEYGRRVRLGELVALHAAAKAREHLTPEGREMALRRVVRHYLTLAAAADLAAMGDRMRFATHTDEIVARAAEFADGRAALDSLDPERHNLVGVIDAAAAQGWFAEVWQLCEALWPWFLNRRHLRDWMVTTQRGVEAAAAAGDPAVEARMRSQLARALVEQRRYDQAEEHLRVAADLAERSGHRLLRASVREFTGDLYFQRGAYDRAAGDFRGALAINREIGRVRGQLVQLHKLGRALHLSGDHQSALVALEEASALVGSLPKLDARNQGSVLTTTAKVLVALDRRDEAAEALRTAVPLLRTAGADLLRAQALEQLAVLEPEGDHLRVVEEIYRAAGSPEADRIAGLRRDPAAPRPDAPRDRP